MSALDAAVIAAFKRTSAATVSGRLFRRGLRNVLIRGVRSLCVPAGVMVGPAYTLRYIPSREDLDGFGAEPDANRVQREAFEQAPTGSVLVMDCRAETRAACCGDILVARFMVRGGVGLVSDGGVRDAGAVAQMAMPVFCAGASPPVNRVAHHALDHGQPIACGGVAVYPGDVIVGDGDGVVVVPAHMAAEVAFEAAEQEEMEAWLAKRVLAGEPLEGVFPPNAATTAEYEAFRVAKGPRS